MRTLDEVMVDQRLPWKRRGLAIFCGDVLVIDAADEESLDAIEYAVRAANAFPKLVEFMQGQPCRCYLPNEHDKGLHKGPTCSRCALLEEALR